MINAEKVIASEIMKSHMPSFLEPVAKGLTPPPHADSVTWRRFALTASWLAIPYPPSRRAVASGLATYVNPALRIQKLVLPAGARRADRVARSRCFQARR